MAFTQDGRFLAVKTSLGPDKLLLAGFRGREAISSLFEFELDLLSEDADLDLASLIGQSISFAIQPRAGEAREFSGFVRRIVYTGIDASRFRRYRAEIVPQLWFLTLRSDRRIFQDLTVVQIVKQVFEDVRFDTYDDAGITKNYPTLEYCVQMGESDFDFVSRLLEDEGIFYFFRFENHKHILVLADGTAAYKDCATGKVDFNPSSPNESEINEWQHGLEFVSGKWTLMDFDFTKPTTNLNATVDTVLKHPAAKTFERYDYPGGYVEKHHGEERAKVRMEADEARFEVATGSGGCWDFSLATRFELSHRQYAKDDGKKFVLTAIQHAASEGSYAHGASSGTGYSNHFECIPEAVLVRPERKTSRPVVFGPQTAIVVGPSGEEIHTDKYGRIKVQFHWDRVGKLDDNSSCWIRVAQSIAGKQWGSQFLPRVGQEVVVAFLDGDPDRPLVTGAVYNANTMPAYELPANKTQSGLRSRSTKDGGTSELNEIRFEDKKGSEHIYIHAQKDEHHHVLNDRHDLVGNDEHLEVKKSKKEKIGGDHHLLLGGDEFVKIGGDCNETIAGERKVKVTGADGLDVGGDLSAKIGGEFGLDVTGDHKLKAMNIHGDAGMNLNLKAGMNWAAEGGLNLHLKGAINVVIESNLQITLKAGPSFVVVGVSGVQISGPMVMINSGGAAGSGTGCSPQAPGAPAAPDAPAAPKPPMDVAAAANPEAQKKPGTTTIGAVIKQALNEFGSKSPQTAAFEAAAAKGTPFCEACQ